MSSQFNINLKILNINGDDNRELFFKKYSKKQLGGFVYNADNIHKWYYNITTKFANYYENGTVNIEDAILDNYELELMKKTIKTAGEIQNINIIFE